METTTTGWLYYYSETASGELLYEIEIPIFYDIVKDDDLVYADGVKLRNDKLNLNLDLFTLQQLDMAALATTEANN